MPTIRTRKPKYQTKPKYADALMWTTANAKEFKRFVSNHRKCYIKDEKLVVVDEDGIYVLKPAHYLVREYELSNKNIVSRFVVMHYEEFEKLYVRCEK